MEGPLTPCSASQKTVMKIRAVYDAVVPNNFKSTDLRAKMDAVLADAMDDYCDTTVPVVMPASSPAAMMMNNHCEKYPRHTVRYTQCVLSEQNAKTYP